MQFYASDSESILRVLHDGSNRENGYAVRRACHELARLVAWNSSVRLRLAQDGVIGALKPIVEFHVEQDAAVVMDCCRFLRRCVSLKEPTELGIQTKITEAGFLSIMQTALVTHSNNTELFNEVCRLVAVLCCDVPHAPHADNQDEIAQCGLLASILGHLKNHQSDEEDTRLACEATLAVLFENEDTIRRAVDDYGLLHLTSHILERFISSTVVLRAVTRLLFQVVVGMPDAKDEIVNSCVLERVFDFLEAHPRACDADAFWHVIKCVEILSRESDLVKDELCRYRALHLIILCVQHIEASNRKAVEPLLGIYFTTCIIFSRIALSDDDPTANNGLTSWPTVETRVNQLMQAGVHQFALQVLKVVGSRHTQVAEQAVRVLEIMASIGECHGYSRILERFRAIFQLPPIPLWSHLGWTVLRHHV